MTYIKQGIFGKIKISNKKFIIEVHSKIDNLKWQIGNVFSPTCRTIFGNKKCGINVQKYTHISVIDRIINNVVIFSKSLENFANGYFDFGKIIFYTANDTKQYKVKEFSAGYITLSDSLIKNITVGSKFEIAAGCNKEFATCRTKFNNALNFRGEPHIPSAIKLVR
ncbi:DUF2163 domain-containing protein [Rickettsia endosymbiont of Cardiosporidium cionae]|uniref:DUF2163 domain-containing protein n=1 Tax=Rickettsia endosymbiont of Cardiosporidium cionae TaxID=2777155 RepID=UPI001894535F